MFFFFEVDDSRLLEVSSSFSFHLPMVMLQQMSAPGPARSCHVMQVYGYQGIGAGCQSEQLLGQLVKQHRAAPGAAPLIVATKFFTVPWTNLLVGGGLRIGRQSMIKALRASLQRLGLDKVDLWQV